MNSIYPFFIVCGYNTDINMWMPLKSYVDKDSAIKYSKHNKYSFRYPHQCVFSLFNLEFENGYYDQEGWHEYK